MFFLAAPTAIVHLKKQKKTEGNHLQKNVMLRLSVDQEQFVLNRAKWKKACPIFCHKQNNLLLGCFLFCSGSVLHCRKASQAAESQAILGTLNFTECVCTVCIVLIL